MGHISPIFDYLKGQIIVRKKKGEKSVIITISSYERRLGEKDEVWKAFIVGKRTKSSTTGTEKNNKPRLVNFKALFKLL